MQSPTLLRPNGGGVRCKSDVQRPTVDSAEMPTRPSDMSQIKITLSDDVEIQARKASLELGLKLSNYISMLVMKDAKSKGTNGDSKPEFNKLLTRIRQAFATKKSLYGTDSLFERAYKDSLDTLAGIERDGDLAALYAFDAAQPWMKPSNLSEEEIHQVNLRETLDELESVESRLQHGG